MNLNYVTAGMILCAGLWLNDGARAENVEIWLDSTNAADRLLVRDSEGTLLTETTADGRSGFGCNAGSNAVTVAGGLHADRATISGETVMEGALSVNGSVTATAYQGDGAGVTNVSVAWDHVTEKPEYLVIENRTNDPSAPQTGRIWLRTDL